MTLSPASSRAVNPLANVDSVFGRTGVVVATAGDYTAALVTNAADKSSASDQTFTGKVSAPAHIAAGLTGATAASRYVGATASGAPVAGTFAVGDFIIDQSGKVYVCTVAGTPGTWTLVGGATPTLAQVLAAGASANSVAVTSLGNGSAATDAINVGQVATAAGGVAWTVVTKGSDESVTSSTTLQDDDALFFTAASGGIYEVQLVLVYASPAGAGTPDLKYALGEDSSVVGTFQHIGIATNEVAAAGANLSSLSSTITRGTAAANRAAFALGVHVGLGGTFKLQWAQNTSDANATTVRAGSVLRYRRIL